MAFVLNHSQLLAGKEEQLQQQPRASTRDTTCDSVGEISLILQSKQEFLSYSVFSETGGKVFFCNVTG